MLLFVFLMVKWVGLGKRRFVICVLEEKLMRGEGIVGILCICLLYEFDYGFLMNE